MDVGLAHAFSAWMVPIKDNKKNKKHIKMKNNPNGYKNNKSLQKTGNLDYL